MKPIIYICLAMMLISIAYGYGDNWLLHFSDGTTTINGTDVCISTGACLSDAGGSYDLDVAGDAGTGSITNAETFTIQGSNYINTSMSGNTMTIKFNGSITGSGGGNSTQDILNAGFNFTSEIKTWVNANDDSGGNSTQDILNAGFNLTSDIFIYYYAIDSRYDSSNFTSAYYAISSRYDSTNFTSAYYAISSRYDSSNFTTNYYAITSRYDSSNFTSDYYGITSRFDNTNLSNYLEANDYNTTTDIKTWVNANDDTGGNSTDEIKAAGFNFTTEIKAYYQGSENISIIDGVITFNMTCEEITGSAGLCDGDDNAGAGSYDWNYSGDTGGIGVITDSELFNISGNGSAKTYVESNKIILECTDTFNSTQDFTDAGFNFTSEIKTWVNANDADTQLTQEQVQDYAGAMANNGDGTTMTYSDAGDTLTVDLMVCSNTQILKYNGGWTCDADDTGSGGNSTQDILNAGFNLTEDLKIWINANDDSGGNSTQDILDAGFNLTDDIFTYYYAIDSRYDSTNFTSDYYGITSRYADSNFTSAYYGIGSRFDNTNFTTQYYGITSRYADSNFTSAYYGITSRYDSTNFTTQYYGITSRYDYTNLTSDAGSLFINVTGDKMTGNLNMTGYNTTDVDCIRFVNGAKICGVS